MNVEQLWESACQILKEEMADISYTTWIRGGLKPYALRNDVLLLECMVPFAMQIMMENYAPKVQTAVNTAAIVVLIRESASRICCISPSTSATKSRI